MKAIEVERAKCKLFSDAIDSIGNVLHEALDKAISGPDNDMERAFRADAVIGIQREYVDIIVGLVNGIGELERQVADELDGMKAKKEVK